MWTRPGFRPGEFPVFPPISRFPAIWKTSTKLPPADYFFRLLCIAPFLGLFKYLFLILFLIFSYVSPAEPTAIFYQLGLHQWVTNGHFLWVGTPAVSPLRCIIMYVGIVKRGLRGKLIFRLVKFLSLRLIFSTMHYSILHAPTNNGVANEQVLR